MSGETSSSGWSRPPSDLIDDSWRELANDGPGVVASFNPAHPSERIWGGVPDESHVDWAVASARVAFGEWSRYSFERRAAVLRRFQKLCVERVDALAALIRDEVGKPLWDAKAEAQLLATKVDITLEEGPTAALNRVRGFELALGPGKAGRAWFRPHGVMAVLGPFNFPAHLPNGHIVPALAMGNTIVFKPSDKAPAVGQFLVEMLQEALQGEAAPAGVVNLVQGGAGIAARLASHDDLDGILFTGSWPVGRKIMQANLDRPGRILALEMGGNNPAIVMPDADLKQAITEVVRCAFIGAGQRCTCTRRLIVHRDVADRVISAICKAAGEIVVGDPRAAHPVFMGPVISRQARDAILGAQERFAKDGGVVLVPCAATDAEGWFLTPGVMRVDRFRRGDDGPGADVEVFGPLLRVSVVDSLYDAIAQANATRFGLAASIFAKDQASIDQFLAECRAGCLNVNTGTAGASSKLPFGGLGHSGNHRPAGAFSLDYCAYPVAGMVESGGASTTPPGMRVDEEWIR